MTPDEPADVIGNLPRARPARRSPHRAPRADGTPAAVASEPVAAKPKTAATKTKVGAPKPRTSTAKPKTASPTGKVRGVTKTAPARKVAERTRTEASSTAATPAPPIPPAGYAVPGTAPAGDGGLNLAETIRGAAQLAEAGFGALRSLIGR